jgi:putative transposase
VGISCPTKKRSDAYSERMNSYVRSAISEKKRWASSRAASGCRFPFIAEHCQQYPITVLCKTLEVSQSGYSAWSTREPSQQCREDARLSATIQQIFLEHRQVYGSPRMHAALKARGIHCSRKRVVRLMQQLGLSAQLKKRRKPTTRSTPFARFAPTQLNREFAARVPNQKWVTDTKAVETRDRLALSGGDAGSVLAPGGRLGHGGDRR